MFKKLLDGCNERKLPFQMGYMFRNNPAMMFCKKAVDEGLLGDIFEVQASMSHNYGNDDYDVYLSSFKGGIMYNLGCHFIDFFVHLLGRPENVTPFMKSVPGSKCDVFNNCLSIIEYPHCTVTLRVCSGEIDGHSQRRLKICGTKGTLELCPLEIFNGKNLTMNLILRNDTEQYCAGSNVIDFGVTLDRYQEQLLELAAIIRGDKENPYTYEHDYLVQQVVLAASGCTEWK